jgi:hypothetical protein
MDNEPQKRQITEELDKLKSMIKSMRDDRPQGQALVDMTNAVLHQRDLIDSLLRQYRSSSIDTPTRSRSKMTTLKRKEKKKKAKDMKKLRESMSEEWMQSRRKTDSEKNEVMI